MCEATGVQSSEAMEYVDNYKYLGCCINEFGLNGKRVSALTAAASGSYERIINNF